MCSSSSDSRLVEFQTHFNFRLLSKQLFFLISQIPLSSLALRNACVSILGIYTNPITMETIVRIRDAPKPRNPL